MLSYLIRRLFAAAIVVSGVLCLVFLLIQLVPGDPVEVMLGESASQVDRQALRVALGLDRSLAVQLGSYLSQLAQGDLGTSLFSQRSISELLRERIPATLLLAAAALVIALSLAVPLGIMAALRKDSLWDTAAMGFALLGVSIPNFWLGPLLILVFSLGLGWFPVSGTQGGGAWVLPALTLGTALAAILSRMVRSSLLEVLNEDYMRTARAKGLSPSRVVWVHGMRNALLPVITLLGLQLGALLGGAVITETVFAWPGVGSLTIEAIQRRDYPLVQACVLLISLSYVFINLLTDLLYAWIDPRIRLGGGAT